MSLQKPFSCYWATPAGMWLSMHFGFYFDISHELAILANTKAKLIWYIEVYLYQRICSKKDKFSSNCPPTFECRSPPLKGENSNKIPVCGFIVVQRTTCVRRREQVVEHLAFKSFGERYVQILYSSVAFKIFREMRSNVTCLNTHFVSRVHVY